MSLATRQVHLDFHTGQLPFEVGQHFNKHTFQQTIQKSHINSVTLAARDHFGWVYYQSARYTRHPQLGTRDFLAEQVAALHEINVKAPLYLTAGWDATMAWRHPEWLERQEDGATYGFEDHGQLNPGWKTLCFNTPYVDYLIAQTKDLLAHFDYQVDGLFYDIVWQDQCYCNACLDQMLAQNLDPEQEADRRSFAIQTEQRFKQRIVQAVESVASSCPVVFNEGNVTPIIRPNLGDYDHLEIESLPGGKWGYQHFPVTVRYAKNLGKDYLGMTGRFHGSWGDFGSYRDSAALEYENMLALIHGAQCSIGDQMYPDGTLSRKAYELIGNIYAKVEQYEEYEQSVTPVCDIAILHPGILGDTEEQPDIALAGAVNMLNELHFQFDIIDDVSDWLQYKLLVLPDKLKLTTDLQQRLDQFIQHGGKVLATYQSGLNPMETNFPESWNLAYVGKNQYTPTYYKLSNDNTEYVLNGQGLAVSPTNKNNSILASQWLPLYQRSYRHYYGHYQAPIGEHDKQHPVGILLNDTIIYFNYPLFTMYKEQGATSYRDLVKIGIERVLVNSRFITYEHFPSTGDCVLNQQCDQHRLVLGLLNYVPTRQAMNNDTIKDVLPLPGVIVNLNWPTIQDKLHLKNQPSRIYSGVTGQSLNNEPDKLGNIKVTLPTINGYEFVIIDY